MHACSHIFVSISQKIMKLKIQPNSVKGFLDPVEGEALYKNALSYSLKGPCLEIGSYCGKSALYIGSAVKENNQKLYSIDHHKGSEEQQLGEEYCDLDLINESGDGINTLPYFLETIKRANLENTVKPIISSSEEAEKNWKEPLAFILIDGGHSQKAAMTDYRLWNKHIIPGGLLAIHDVFPNPEDGGRPPFEIYSIAKESGNYKERPMVKSLALLEKIK
jgi:predicted O-methyltransferase YrrM